MSEAATTEHPVSASAGPHLPPAARVPKLLQGLVYVLARRQMIDRLTRRHGAAFVANIPMFGKTVILTDPALAKQVFTTSPEELGNVQPNLSRIFGPGSVFALDGDDHRRRRKLLTPPFHGKAMKNYEKIVEEETRREMASWPDDQPFETLEPMMRITLNIILRAIFGADGAELDRLREVIPPWVTLGSRLVVFPEPARDLGPLSPWRRLHDYRRTYESVIDTLIAQARADEHFDERTDVLSLFLRSAYEDGSTMTPSEIGDELLTLLAAGHETTASTLAWAFERVSRHPAVLAELVAEAQTDGNEYRQATILEVQRARTVIDFCGRHVWAPMVQIGQWRIPRGYSVLVSINQLHANTGEFPDPQRFDPTRFVGKRPNMFAWAPFGGGTRRCVGAAFANMEMDVVLRTVLRHFDVETTTARDEKVHSRGVAFTPKDGGRVVMRRRPTPLGS
ncbi:cytochrome P450 [Mycolicibacterium arseniciresistens]|uniref:Cytochrome P450 n=1 Tax=Mycolicibacterium arseniciresistens TaxID=3062257 RepID=A0ABT8UG28_9MYCO|nr:cytochrome P450 [Mycolicibacterium arseniciresistens]MDO3635830.1 cytochrome P450 [Mycolicibacterium arseniciresistens]